MRQDSLIRDRLRRDVGAPSLALWVMGLASSLVAHALSAQTPVPSTADTASAVAAEAITAADVRRHLDVLTADSMERGRVGTAGLHRMARYVAAQWRAAGFAVDSQAFPVPGGFMPDLALSKLRFVTDVRAQSRPVVTEDGWTVYRILAVSFADGARLGSDTLLESGTYPGFRSGEFHPVPFLSGPHTAASARAAGLRDGTVLVVEPRHADAATLDSVVRTLGLANDVIVVSGDDSVTFARRQAEQRRHLPTLIPYSLEPTVAPRHWVAQVRLDAVAAFFAGMGIDVRRWQADTVPSVQTFPALGIGLAIEARPPSLDTTRAALNIYAVVPGTDTAQGSRYKSYMTMSASLDGGPGTLDSTGGGRDLTGVAGLLALAEAFQRPGGRPRRTVVLLATSGVGQGGPGVTGLWGAQAGWGVPPFNLTLDHLGHGPRDSLVAEGVADVHFTTRPEWIVMQHPELGLGLVGGTTDVERTSDHTIAIRLATPSVLLRGGPGGPGGTASDPDLVARRVRLVYYLTQAVTSAPRWPSWTTESRVRRLTSAP